MRPTVSFSVVSVRPATVTVAPSEASVSAAARPMPVPPPVTNATLPSSSLDISNAPVLVLIVRGDPCSRPGNGPGRGADRRSFIQSGKLFRPAPAWPNFKVEANSHISESWLPLQLGCDRLLPVPGRQDRPPRPAVHRRHEIAACGNWRGEGRE